MKFLSTVFFVVLTIGIPNVHAVWEVEREPLRLCFVTFFGEMYNYSVELRYVQDAKIEKSKFVEGLEAKFGYPTTFEKYEGFVDTTLSVLNTILEPFEEHSFVHGDSNVVKDMRNMVKNLSSCINSNDKIYLYRDIPAPVRGMKRAGRPNTFEKDVASNADTFSKPGTSSAPQAQAPPTEKSVINEDYGYMRVCPRAPQLATEHDWWLRDLQNLGTNQDE